jgi:threonine dehydratase
MTHHSNTFEPRIVAFFCNWCTYTAADLAGVSRLKYAANIRVIRLMCSGRVDPQFIVQALTQGADGVLIGWLSLGCSLIIGLEILEDLPDVDAVVVPWGGGGLACGIASAVKALRPACRVYAAELAIAGPLAPSMTAGAPVTVDYHPSFVDGIGAKSVFPSMLARARKGALIDGVLVAGLAEVAAAVRLLAERNHVIAEGAGACALACALRHFTEGTGEPAPAPACGPAPVPGSKVVCIVSGGNIDSAKLATILAGGVP